MGTPDPFEFPEIRVQSVSAVEFVPVVSVPHESKSGRLARQWLEAWNAKRQAEETMKRLRVEIERMLEDGEMVGDNSGYVTWQTGRVLKADPVRLFDAIGPKLYLRVSEVSSSKLRDLVEANYVRPDADFLFYETTRRLVTRLKSTADAASASGYQSDDASR